MRIPHIVVRTALLTVALFFGTCVAPGQAPADAPAAVVLLDVGAPAPAIKATTWLNGKPVGVEGGGETEGARADVLGVVVGAESPRPRGFNPAAREVRRAGCGVCRNHGRVGGRPAEVCI